MDITLAQSIASHVSGSGGVGAEIGVRMLEKANDQIEQQGKAMVNLIEASSLVDSSQGKIDAHA